MLAGFICGGDTAMVWWVSLWRGKAIQLPGGRVLGALVGGVGGGVGGGCVAGWGMGLDFSCCVFLAAVAVVWFRGCAVVRWACFLVFSYSMPSLVLDLSCWASLKLYLYEVCNTKYHVSLCLWLIGSVLKHRKVPKDYDQDCRCFSLIILQC